MTADPTLDTRQKALRLNLDPRWYGTFAEIGAGQEVVRWFFQVGGAAGTIAKSISAYDMTVSDAIYGKADRYVSRIRLESMLKREFDLDVQRLTTKRGNSTCFFSFADTVAARSFKGGNECHGWMGVMFQHEPLAKPSRIILHVRMLDADALLQAEALGVVGVNLLHGAAFLHQNPEALLNSLLDQLSVNRIEINLIEFSGEAFRTVDNRLMSLKLVQLGLSGAAMFGPDGAVLQPSEALYKKAVLVERGSFHPVTKVHIDMLDQAAKRFRNDPDLEDKPIVELAEITMRNLLSDQPNVDPRNFLHRADTLAACGKTVLVSDFSEYFRLAEYLRKITQEPIGLALSSTRVMNLFDEKFYSRLPGGILEAFGRLLKHQIRLFVYPAINRATETITSVDNLHVGTELQPLYDYLRNRGSLLHVEPSDPALLRIFPSEVIRSIRDGSPDWKTMVPPSVADRIIRDRLFDCPEADLGKPC